MPQSKVRADAQVQNVCEYDDNIVPSEAVFETNPTCLQDDIQNVISSISNLYDGQATDWYVGLNTPATFTGEGETGRGVNDLNTDLHELERKRFLTVQKLLEDVVVGGTDNFVILPAAALPSTTTAAVGAVNTPGVVVAAHMAFGAHSLDEVAGSHALAPKNFVEITDAAGDPILSAGRRISGLLQSENATDGHTLTAVASDRVQISFVRPNAAFTDLEAAPVADIQGQTIRYCYCERKAFDDLVEQDFAAKGAQIDIGAGATTVNRQVSYDNQGTVPVDQTTNAILDLEGPGLSWQLRDDLEACLFSVTEGSAAGTSSVNVCSDVDNFLVEAVTNEFTNGASFNTSGDDINVGVTPNQIDSAGALTITSGGAADTTVASANCLLLDDVNQAGSTWAQTGGIKLSTSTMEWDDFETKFGEVSLLNAICQAFSGANFQKTCVDVTTAVTAGSDVTAAALSAAIHDISGGGFGADHDIYYNGVLLRDGVGNDVTAGADLTAGQFVLAFDTKVGDNVCVISRQ